MTAKKTLGRPATPDELGIITPDIPPGVFDVINEMLAKSRTVMQSVLVKTLCERLTVTRADLFDNHWLDFEAAYERAGWSVRYDKPGYNEDYEPFWEFERKEDL